MFEMKEEYKTGIAQIDAEHTKLFEIGERAFQLIKNSYSPDKYDDIVSIVYELREYAQIHFKNEEEYMKSINYKKLFTQVIDHQEFMNKVNSIDFNKLDHNQDEYLMNLLEFVAKWLTDHIIEKDLLIAEN
ncbi:hemerythrin family protein [Clostridium sp. 19966]|uniref:bacteriohemerythrin n=1 Tax=Clostridium sp. 19966 TaxID=2768166 RepID=UPI0028E08824|nr:hemerythrin family protein [Clostridium sp. 19966]MDT8718699.1 hemerythrin family protein [Clostridium sp. 19966]